MDAMSHVTWIPHPQELVKLHVYFTKTSLTKELYVENKSLHQLTQDHPSKQLLKIDQSLCIREYQSLIYGSTYVMKQTLKQIACVMLLMMTKPNYPGALSNYMHSGVQQNKYRILLLIHNFVHILCIDKVPSFHI